MLLHSEELLSATEIGKAIQTAMKLPQEATWADAIVHKMFREAVKGNLAASREMADRIEGRAPQRMEITMQPKTEVTFQIVFIKTNQTPSEE